MIGHSLGRMDPHRRSDYVLRAGLALLQRFLDDTNTMPL